MYHAIELRGRGALAALAAAAITAGFLVGAAPGTAPAAPAGSDGFPAKCERPPFTMRLESGADPAAGGAEFEVADAVARRVPILTGRDEPGQTQEELERLEKQAAKTRLAMYQIFVADFRIPRRDVTGEFSGAFPEIDPKPGRTAGTISVVPVRARGFKRGDVVRFEDELRYEITTTFSTVGLGVSSSESEDAIGTLTGRVKILGVDEDQICVDVDLELTNADVLVAAAEGVVTAPVVRAPRQTYFF
ncbi:MAG TPA: hypothetical protein VMQ81_08340 [Acidimicrobiia bacterium]|nr:hypothetical protein [Acidimicrobiia bacterium]